MTQDSRTPVDAHLAGLSALLASRGASATEIHEITVLMEFSGAAEDLARTTHAHPTLSEAIAEAALDSLGRMIHA